LTSRSINDDKVVDIGKKLVSALRWDGVADIDLLVDDRDQSMKILEINPRFWQTLPGCIMAGVNFPLLWCLSGLGRIYPENRYHTTKYARPSVFVDLLISRLRGEKPPVRLSWRESDIQFILKDPLPETTHTFPKLVRKVATKTVYHRFKRPKKNCRKRTYSKQNGVYST
jgi:predicted ATP-grasp superfamily ATP-dependent carboligase